MSTTKKSFKKNQAGLIKIDFESNYQKTIKQNLNVSKKRFPMDWDQCCTFESVTILAKSFMMTQLASTLSNLKNIKKAMLH